MVKDHSDSEKGNPLPPHRLLLSINSKGSFICTIPQIRITHTTAFVTPVVEHWLDMTWQMTFIDKDMPDAHSEIDCQQWTLFFSQHNSDADMTINTNLLVTICIFSYLKM